MHAGLGFGAWQLTGLTSLSLQNGSSLSDVGLAAVARLASLRLLNLKGCRNLTDAGVTCLPGLHRLSNLRLQVRPDCSTAQHSTAQQHLCFLPATAPRPNRVGAHASGSDRQGVRRPPKRQHSCWPPTATWQRRSSATTSLAVSLLRLRAPPVSASAGG